MLQSKSRAWAVIDRKAILHNLAEVRKLIDPKTKIMAVVKANCYGHGDKVVAKLLENNGVDMFAVSNIDEALNLRNIGIQSDILILGYTPEVHFHYLVSENLIQNFLSLDYAQKCNQYAQENNAIIRGHIKVDTGMGRLGIRCVDSDYNVDEVEAIYHFSSLSVEGIFSHFSVADELDEDNLAYTQHQYELYEKVLHDLKERGIDVGCTHLQNSYGVLNYKFDYDYVRPGLLLLGVTSDDRIPIRSQPQFIPAFSLYANVSRVKTIEPNESISYGRHYISEDRRVIATLSIGYADGIPRLASNRSMYVLIQGKKCPVVGNICMDQMMVDVSECHNVCEGDRATLIGCDGQNRITVDEWSRASETINNELLCAISARVPRFYTRIE